MNLELTLIDKKQETPDTITLKFDTSSTGFDYIAGQYVNMMLDVKDDPKGNIRQLSIASSPTEKNFIMFSTKVSDTPFKQKLNSLKPGDKIKIRGPFGNFTLPSDYSKQIVMLSGGIGITPLRSMMKFATDEKLDAKIILLYSNRTPENILYRNDLNNMQRLNKNLEIIHTVTRPEESKEKWSGRTGRIDEKMIREFMKDIGNSIFYICGPPSMADALHSLLESMNVNEENIRIEEFVGYE